MIWNLNHRSVIDFNPMTTTTGNNQIGIKPKSIFQIIKLGCFVLIDVGFCYQLQLEIENP